MTDQLHKLHQAHKLKDTQIIQFQNNSQFMSQDLDKAKNENISL